MAGGGGKAEEGGQSEAGGEGEGRRKKNKNKRSSPTKMREVWASPFGSSSGSSRPPTRRLPTISVTDHPTPGPPPPTRTDALSPLKRQLLLPTTTSLSNYTILIRNSTCPVSTKYCNQSKNNNNNKKATLGAASRHPILPPLPAAATTIAANVRPLSHSQDQNTEVEETEEEEGGRPAASAP